MQARFFYGPSQPVGSVLVVEVQLADSINEAAIDPPFKSPFNSAGSIVNSRSAVGTRPACHTNSRLRGFILVELLVVIAIDGNFQFEPAQGLAPGAYHVTIEVLQPDLEDYEQRRSQGRSGLADMRIPEKYGQPQAFRIEVVAEQENHFSF